MTNRRVTPAFAACLPLVAITFASGTAAAQTPRPAREPDFIPPYVIFGWIERYHPNVIAGDPRVNAVMVVADTNNRYVASVADSLSRDPMTAIDSSFALVEAKNAAADAARELVAGRLRVPGSDGSRPLYVVDGVRVKNIDSLSADGIVGIRLLKAADAMSTYGADGANGAIVVTTMHAQVDNGVLNSDIRRRLTKMGIRPERVDLGNLMQMHVRGGVVGPNSLYITVLHLKGGAT
jgi:hypothetical protein